jgi:hypothetical protein
VQRLPSLFSHLLFLFFSYKLVKDFQSKWLVIASFLIINLNPYMLDFFSLSRGYGLSLGLMMAGIYYLFALLTQGYKPHYFLLATVFGFLATLANFVMLNYFVVSFGLSLLFIADNIFQTDNSTKQKTIAFLRLTFLPLCIFIFSLCFLVLVAFKLKEAGALFYGGNKGFWTDTFCTITDRCFYEVGYNYWFQRFAKGFVIFIFVLACACVGFRVIKKQTTKTNRFLGFLILLLFLCALSTIVQHYLFDTLYLIERTALFLVVLFNLMFVFFINEITKEIKAAAVFVNVASILAIVHFIFAFNLNYVLEWRSESDVKQMLCDLEKVKETPKEKNNIDICIPLDFDQPINYYRAVNNLTWVNTLERSTKINYLFDYLYIIPSEFGKINMDSLEIIKTYPATNSILAKPRYAPNLTKVCFSKTLDFENSPDGKYKMDEKTEYGQGFDYIVNDSITPGRNAEVIFKATVWASDISNCNLMAIVSLENKKGVYLWKRAYVCDYIKKENEWIDVYFTGIVPAETMAGDELKSYIWNPNKQTLFVKKMELKWLSKP